MKKYWIITSRTKKGPQIAEHLNQQLGSHAEYISPFNLPDLRVGTYDSLFAMSDDLVKVDTFCASVTRKIATMLVELAGVKVENAESTLKIESATIDAFLKKFRWNEARFQTKSKLQEIVQLIQEQVSRIDDEYRSKSSEFTTSTHALQAEEKKQTGSLMMRNLTDIITEDFVVQTAFLTTLFVVVPRHSIKEWLNSYESLNPFVLPRSSREVFADNEHALYSVVIMQKYADDFKGAAREKRFTVRDFTFSAANVNSGSVRLDELTNSRDTVKKDLLRWCELNFGEAFSAWAHLKTVRVFIESVLRYSLPVDYQGVVMVPKKKSEKKIRDVLATIFSGAGGSMANAGGDEEGLPVAGLVTEKFYPYVFGEFNLAPEAVGN